MVDFRSKSTTALPTAGASTPTQHPELNNEVAALSEKLINSINHQTQLDDLLASTRHELEQAQQRIRELEAAKQEHADMVANGLLVERKDVEAETNKLMRTISEERKQRGEAEKEKKSMEQELETLTTALFEEANQVGSCLWLFPTRLLTIADGFLRAERARRFRTPK
jgi:chromosome segregation ATPase